MDPRLDLTSDEDFKDALDFINQDEQYQQIKDALVEDSTLSSHSPTNENDNNFPTTPTETEKIMDNTSFHHPPENENGNDLEWGHINLDSDDETDSVTIYFNVQNFQLKAKTPFTSSYGTTFYDINEIQSCLADCLPKENARIISLLQRKGARPGKMALVKSYYKIIKATKGLIAIFAPEMNHDRNCKCEQWLDIFLPDIKRTEKVLTKKIRVFPRHIIQTYRRNKTGTECYLQSVYNKFNLCYKYYANLYLNLITKRKIKGGKKFQDL